MPNLASLESRTENIVYDDISLEIGNFLTLLQKDSVDTWIVINQIPLSCSGFRGKEISTIFWEKDSIIRITNIDKHFRQDTIMEPGELSNLMIDLEKIKAAPDLEFVNYYPDIEQTIDIHFQTTDYSFKIVNADPVENRNNARYQLFLLLNKLMEPLSNYRYLQYITHYK
jgi:hypothetical protein